MPTKPTAPFTTPTLIETLNTLPQDERSVINRAAWNIFGYGLMIGMLVGSIGASIQIFS